MFSQIWTHKSTGISSALIPQLLQALDQSDAVVIGAGAGLSASAGLTYPGSDSCGISKTFKTGMASGICTPGILSLRNAGKNIGRGGAGTSFSTATSAPKPVYTELLELVRNRNYFILTTNVDHQFQLAGFNPDRLFQTQGDYGLWQCATPCHAQTYANERSVRQMVAEQTNMRIPHCAGSPTALLRRAHDDESALR